MTEHTYRPTDQLDATEIDGEEVAYSWWEGTVNLSPLPDAALPRFPRRLDWEGREDGGWLELGDGGAYGPCGCCNTRPCVPQCPVQAIPPRTPEFWLVRWRKTAEVMMERGQEVNPLYQQPSGENSV